METIGQPEPTKPSDRAIESLDFGGYLHKLERLDPNLPNYVFSAFRREWHATQMHKSRAGSLYRRESDGVNYAGIRYMPWECDVFFMALNAGIEDWSQKSSKDEISTKIHRQLINALSPPLNAHTSVMASRVLRPSGIDDLWAAGEQNSSSRGALLEEGDPYTGWSRCGLYEECSEAIMLRKRLEEPVRRTLRAGSWLVPSGWANFADVDILPFCPALVLLKPNSLSADISHAQDVLYGPVCAMGYLRDEVGNWPVVGINPAILQVLGLKRTQDRSAIVWTTLEGIEAARLRVWRSEPSGLNMSANRKSCRRVGCDFIIRSDLFAKIEKRAQTRAELRVEVAKDE